MMVPEKLILVLYGREGHFLLFGKQELTKLHVGAKAFYARSRSMLISGRAES